MRERKEKQKELNSETMLILQLVSPIMGAEN